jgi:TolB protein
MNTDGSGQTRLTPNGGGFPDWSPDGSRIAFDTFFEGRPEIFVMNPDGTKPARISNGGGLLADWSPDNSMIAFAVGFFSGGPLGDIYIMNADGSGRTNLTNSPEAFDSEPVWQP